MLQDLHTVNLEAYKYAGATIIGLNVLDPVREDLEILKMDSQNMNVSYKLISS